MSESDQFTLLHERRFLPFFVTQALAAFNDNVFKNVLIVLVTYQASSWSSLKPELLANIASFLFIVPFVVFSGIAGQLSERFDKSRVIQSVKAAQIGIMALVGAGFLTHHLPRKLWARVDPGTH